MRLLELNKEWGINETPTDARHYEQEVRQHYAEFFAKQLIQSYVENNKIEVTPYVTHKMIEAWATRDEPAQYAYIHEFRSDYACEFENEAFNLEIWIEGEISEERCANTLEVVRVDISFDHYRMEIQGNEEINKIILDNLNIVE
jgi:hypothetical protein